MNRCLEPGPVGKWVGGHYTFPDDSVVMVYEESSYVTGQSRGWRYEFHPGDGSIYRRLFCTVSQTYRKTRQEAFEDARRFIKESGLGELPAMEAT